MDTSSGPLKKYIEYQTNLVGDYLAGVKSLLDFGCGEMSLDRSLKTKFPAMQITGIDVVKPKKILTGIQFRLYDGKKIPFADNSFDAVLSYHVLHHTDNPAGSFGEIVRVARGKIILIEPVARFQLEKFPMKIADYAANLWRGETIPMPYNFQTKKEWRKIFRDFGVKVISVRAAGIAPVWLPIGGTYLYLLEKP